MDGIYTKIDDCCRFQVESAGCGTKYARNLSRIHIPGNRSSGGGIAFVLCPCTLSLWFVFVAFSTTPLLPYSTTRATLVSSVLYRVFFTHAPCQRFEFGRPILGHGNSLHHPTLCCPRIRMYGCQCVSLARCLMWSGITHQQKHINKNTSTKTHQQKHINKNKQTNKPLSVGGSIKQKHKQTHSLPRF